MKRRNDRRQDIGVEIVRSADMNRAGKKRRQVADLPVQFVFQIAAFIILPDVELSRLRQGQRTGRTVEDLGAERLLRASDRKAQCGLCDVQLSGRFREAFALVKLPPPNC